MRTATGMRAAIIRLVALGALVTAFPAAAHAHIRLVRSDPAHRARLVAPPRAIRLTFSEPPLARLTRLRLSGPAAPEGAPAAPAPEIALADVEVDSLDANSLLFRTIRPLTPGTYRASWSTASRDGHVIRGSIEFVVQQANELQDSPATMPRDPVDTAGASISGGYAALAARLLGFLSLFLILGAVSFRIAVLRRVGFDDDRDPFLHIASTNAATLGMGASVGLLLAAIVRVAAESAELADIPVSTLLLSTLWGWAWILQVLGAVAAGIAFRSVHFSPRAEHSAAWRTALGAALVLAVTPSLSGHAVSTASAILTVPADVLHVIAGSAWLGTLALIVVAGIPAAFKSAEVVRSGTRVGAMINAFSPVALICGGVVVGTGTISALVRLQPFSALWASSYGLTLIVKLFFVALLFAAGAWNWRRMKPRLTEDEAVGPLRSMARLELLLAGAVLAVTAILVAAELP